METTIEPIIRMVSAIGPLLVMTLCRDKNQEKNNQSKRYQR